MTHLEKQRQEFSHSIGIYLLLLETEGKNSLQIYSSSISVNFMGMVDPEFRAVYPLGSYRE